MQVPHAFFHKAGDEAGIDVPAARDFCRPATFSCPRKITEAQLLRQAFERIIMSEGQFFSGLAAMSPRTTAIRPGRPRRRAVHSPDLHQAFPTVQAWRWFERKLFVIRKQVNMPCSTPRSRTKPFFHNPQPVQRHDRLQGLLLADQLPRYYLDLMDQAHGERPGPGSPALLGPYHAHVGSAQRSATWPHNCRINPAPTCNGTGGGRPHSHFQTPLIEHPRERSSDHSAAPRATSTCLDNAMESALSDGLLAAPFGFDAGFAGGLAGSPVR